MTVHAGGVTKRERPATFAAVLGSLPPATTVDEVIAPGRLTSEVAVDPSGTVYRELARVVSGAHVVELVSQGALVAWDSCGCGGYCPVDWLDEAQRAALLAGGAPRIRVKNRPEASMSQWRADDGSSLVLLSGPVRWGTASSG